MLKKVSIVEDSFQEGSNNSNNNTQNSPGRRTRGLGKKTIEKVNTINSDPALSLLKEKTSTVKNLTCKCSRSKCLKMYCECFTQGRYCNESCSCINCCNTKEYKIEIMK